MGGPAARSLAAHLPRAQRARTATRAHALAPPASLRAGSAPRDRPRASPVPGCPSHSTAREWHSDARGRRGQRAPERGVRGDQERAGAGPGATSRRRCRSRSRREGPIPQVGKRTRCSTRLSRSTYGAMRPRCRETGPLGVRGPAGPRGAQGVAGCSTRLSRSTYGAMRPRYRETGPPGVRGPAGRGAPHRSCSRPAKRCTRSTSCCTLRHSSRSLRTLAGSPRTSRRPP